MAIYCVIFIILGIQGCLLEAKAKVNCSNGNQQIRFGYKSYTQYLPGSRCSSIIITSAHGGYLDPSDIPDRTMGCLHNNTCIWSHTCGNKSTECKAMTVRDNYSLEIAIVLRGRIKLITGESPHLIVSHLKRTKLDPNRVKDLATFGVKDAIKAYDDFHHFIEIASKSINGPGMLYDIHGQQHEEGWIELGYLVKDQGINKHVINPNDTALRSLSNRHYSIPFDDILYGKNSLGGLLQQFGYKTVPSPDHPKPNNGTYFNGYVISMKHGSRDKGVIDAVLIESPESVRRLETYVQYGHNLAKAIVQFTRLYY